MKILGEFERKFEIFLRNVRKFMANSEKGGEGWTEFWSITINYIFCAKYMANLSYKRKMRKIRDKLHRNFAKIKKNFDENFNII